MKTKKMSSIIKEQIKYLSKSELKECMSISFNEEEHTYTKDDGSQLSGVTSLMNRHLFTDKYKGVPADVLQKAAERGSNIHKDINNIVVNGDKPTTKESEQFLKYLSDTQSIIVHSEYLVSNETSIASSIDLVNSEFDLIDIKSNRGGIDKEYVRWQLSIYAYLFEKQNGFAPRRLIGLWLSEDEYKEELVDRIDSNLIEELIQCDEMGLPFVPPMPKPIISDDKLQEFVSLERNIIDLNNIIKSLEDAKKVLYADVMSAMKESGCDVWENESIRFKIKSAYTREGIDTNKLKKEKLDIYNEYKKLTNVKESLVVTLKNNEDESNVI